MNTAVISKEQIIRTSIERIQKEGWKSINIRSVAIECGISIGSVYNYFDNKADLMNAVVETIWCDIFHLNDHSFHNFLDCVQWAFDSLKKGEERYPGFFDVHSILSLESGKQQAQQMMKESMKHMSMQLLYVLEQDPSVCLDVFDEVFTKEAFVELIFSYMISSMVQHHYDCEVICAMIQRILYRNK